MLLTIEFPLSPDQLIQPLDQVFRTKMGITFQHLHGPAAGDGGDLLITETGLDQAGYGFMAQIMEPQALNACLLQRAVPGWSELVGPASAIATRFPQKIRSLSKGQTE